MLVLSNMIFAQKYKFELNEIFDFEQKEIFQKIQLEFNNFKTPYKNILGYDGKNFFINSDIDVNQNEFEFFLNKHGYTIKTFIKIQ